MEQDQDYFLSYLSNYLRENNFYLGYDFPTYEQVKDDAELMAGNAETYRKAGMSVNNAVETAMYDLFENVGKSRYEVVNELLCEILGINDLSENEEEFVQRIAILDETLFRNVGRLAYGLAPESIENNKESLKLGISRLYLDTFSTGSIPQRK